VRAVLFDFNGVIADDEASHFEAFRRVLAPRGTALGRARYDDELLGLDDTGVARHLYPGASADEHARFVADKSAAYDALTAGGVPAFPGAVELVCALAAAGAALAIVSGAQRHEIDRVLAAHGILEHFRVIVAAEDVRRCKPDPEGYLLGLERLGALPERSVVIEDSPAGIDAARAAGLRVIGVAHSTALSELHRADLAVPRIADLDADRVMAVSE
jgi:HAD superfamily hydrolase (TIGR01509 family)